MSYDIELCNKEGVAMCGSDGHFNIDKRFGLTRVRMEVQEYRERFVKNFSHKSDYWTHFRFQNRIHKI